MDSHPSHERLKLWLEDCLEDAEATQIAEHVSECTHVCGTFLDQLSPFDQADQAQPVTAECATLTPGTHVESYGIVSFVARGGMGVVYLAWSHKLGRLVALKILDGGARVDPRRRARFQREIEAAASLRHPNIITVHDAGSSGDVPFLVMEYAEHGTLESLLGDHRVEPAAAAALTVLLSRAVQVAHARGVYHRDLKPLNVLLSAHETHVTESPAIAPWSVSIRGLVVVPQIADFGLAKFADEEDPRRRVGLTTTGDHLGTPSYMAPEQVRGDQQIDGRADVYGLGAILYRLLTARAPFEGKSNHETLEQVLHDEPKPPHKFDATIPRDIETICLKCLEKNPERRYATPGELAEDLSRFLRGEPIRARPVGYAEWVAKRVRNRPLVAALCTMAAIAIVLLCVQAAVNFARIESAVKRVEAEKRREYEELVERQRYLIHDKSIRNLRDAQAAVDDGNTGAALQLLGEIPKEERGWAWRHLRKACDGCLFSLVGHEESVTQIEFTPDGARLVSGSKDKTVRIWDARTGLEQRVLRGHTDRVLALAVSPDSSLLASGSADGTVRIWSLRTGQELHRLLGSGAEVACLAFSPDGKSLVSGSRADHAVRVWSVEKHYREMLKMFHKDCVNCVAYSPDGLLIASGSEDGYMVLWDTQTGRERSALRVSPDPTLRVGFTLNGLWTGSRSDVWFWDISRAEPFELRRRPGSLKCAFSAVALSPDGTNLAVEMRRPGIWDIQTRVQVWQGAGPQADTTKWLAFSPNGSLLASASMDKSIRIFDVHAGQRSGRWRIPTSLGKRIGIAFSPQGRQLLVSSDLGNSGTWDTRSGLPLLELSSGKEVAQAVAYSPSGEQFATTNNNELNLWSTHSGEKLIAKVVRGLARNMAYSPDGRVLTSTLGNQIQIWDPSLRMSDRLTVRCDRILGFGVRQDGNEVASVCIDGVVELYNSNTLQLSRSFKLPSLSNYPAFVTYQPGGTALAVAANDSVFVCDSHSGRSPLELKSHMAVTCCHWLFPGQELASSSADGSIRIWNARTGENELMLQTQHPIYGLATNPDGDLLVSCGEDSSIWFWGASRELPGVEIVTYQEAVNCIALSDDGDRLASGGENRTIRTWDTRTGDLLSSLSFDHPIMDVRFEKGEPTDGTTADESVDLDVKKKAIAERRNHIITSADGRVFAQFTSGQLIRVFRQPSEQELNYRRWMTRPDPQWHIEQRKRFEKEQNHFAAHFHRVAEERARAVVASDEGKLDESYWHLVAAAVLQSQKPR